MRTSFVVPRRAIATVVGDQIGTYYEWLEVYSGPRKGLALQLLAYSIQHLGYFPEMDIRYQSTVVQRHAHRLGYSRVGESERFTGCERWIRRATSCKVLSSRLQFLSQRVHGTTGTRVVWLRDPRA